MTPQAGSLLIFALVTLETALALMLIGDAAYDDRSNAGRRVLFGVPHYGCFAAPFCVLAVVGWYLCSRHADDASLQQIVNNGILSICLRAWRNGRRAVFRWQ